MEREILAMNPGSYTKQNVLSAARKQRYPLNRILTDRYTAGNAMQKGKVEISKK
jgi:hypothetical protein